MTGHKDIVDVRACSKSMLVIVLALLLHGSSFHHIWLVP